MRLFFRGSDDDLIVNLESHMVVLTNGSHLFGHNDTSECLNQILCDLATIDASPTYIIRCPSNHTIFDCLAVGTCISDVFKPAVGLP